MHFKYGTDGGHLAVQFQPLFSLNPPIPSSLFLCPMNAALIFNLDSLGSDILGLSGLLSKIPCGLNHIIDFSLVMKYLNMSINILFNSRLKLSSHALILPLYVRLQETLVTL